MLRTIVPAAQEVEDLVGNRRPRAGGKRHAQRLRRVATADDEGDVDGDRHRGRRAARETPPAAERGLRRVESCQGKSGGNRICAAGAEVHIVEQSALAVKAAGALFFAPRHCEPPRRMMGSPRALRRKRPGFKPRPWHSASRQLKPASQHI